MEFNKDEKEIIKILIKKNLKQIDELGKEIFFEDAGEFSSKTEMVLLMKDILKKLNK